MGVFDTIKDIFEEVFKFIGESLAWLDKPENRSNVALILQVITAVVKAVGMLNEPVPKRERTKMVRSTVELLQALSASDLRKIADIKETTDFDSLKGSELDLTVGLAIGGFVKVENDRKRPPGTKPV